jgi:hypothetical protein
VRQRVARGASTRLGAALLAWLIAISTVTGSAAASVVTAATHSPAADSPSAMSWLSVSHGSGAGPRLQPTRGRERLQGRIDPYGLKRYPIPGTGRMCLEAFGSGSIFCRRLPMRRSSTCCRQDAVRPRAAPGTTRETNQLGSNPSPARR